MKIAVLGTRGFPGVQGGIESHCENLYTELAKRGCEVVVFTRKPYVDASVSTHKGVRLVALPSVKNKFLETMLHTFYGLFKAKQEKPDLLHIHAIGPSIFSPLAKMMGMKVVVTNHGPDYDRQKWNAFAKQFLITAEMVGSRSADGVISISDLIAKSLETKYQVQSEVIPNGVLAPAKEQYGTEALTTYGLEPQKYVLAVSRFVPEKGLHDLIQAFNKSHIGRDGDWQLVIAGQADHEDEYSANLKKLAQENPSVVLTGYVTGEPLQQLYAHRGLFVLPSYHEGLPIVALEALSYNYRCLISDIPANLEINLPKERYFRTGNINELAKKIDQFAKHPMLSENDQEIVDKILDHYCWDRIADDTLGLYQSVVKK